MKRIVFMATLTFVVTTAALANIANPDLPKKSIDTTLSIKLDRNAKEAKLIIPKSQIKQLRAELEKLDDGSDHTAAAATSSGGLSGMTTIVSGSLLSLAFVFAGVWVMRTGRLSTKGAKAAAVGVVMLCVGAFASFVYANAGPPSEAREITGKMFTQSVHMYGFGSGKVKLEVSDSERYPTLIVPNGETAKVKE